MKLFRQLALAGALALGLAGPAFAGDDSLTAKNASGATVIFCAKDTGAGVLASCSAVVDTSGAKVNPATKENQATANTSLGSIDTKSGETHGSTGAAAPAKAQYVGVNSGGNLVGLIQADASVKIDVSAATTTQLVALSSGKKIYVTAWDVIAAGTGNLKLVYGTGANCGTGTTDLTGAYNLTAQAGLSKGNGLGAVLVVPASNALCVTTSAAVQMSGSLAYTQF
jgi:hypothetical protein